MKGSELTTAELDQARGRLVRLREMQSRGLAAPRVRFLWRLLWRQSRWLAALSRGRGWHPAGTLALLVGGGAARWLRVSPAAVLRWRRAGRCAAVKAFTLSEIDAMSGRGER